MTELNFSKNILNAFKNVRVALDSLCQHVQELPLPLRIDNGAGEWSEDRKRVTYALKHLVYAPHLTAQETFDCPGLIASTVETLSLLQAINMAKDLFRQVIQDVRHTHGAQASKYIRDVLAQDGHGLVKLKEVYRHLYAITYHPKKVSWTKARNGANVVISYEQALQRLVEKKEKGQCELTKLASLNPAEKLVIHRDIRAYWVVNVAHFKTLEGTPYEKIRKSLPLFYLHSKDLPLPIVKLSLGKPRKNVRSDKLIEDEPFLLSISAYRYVKST